MSNGRRQSSASTAKAVSSDSAADQPSPGHAAGPASRIHSPSSSSSNQHRRLGWSRTSVLKAVSSRARSSGPFRRIQSGEL